MGIPWEWELVTKLGMGMNGNRLHGNGREWECKKPFPGISSIYLAPDEHAAEDNLKPVEEVIADDDDCRASGRPAFIGTDRFDRRRRCAQEPCVHND